MKSSLRYHQSGQEEEEGEEGEGRAGGGRREDREDGEKETTRVGYTSLKLRREARAGNTNLRIIRIQTAFKVMGPDEFTSGHVQSEGIQIMALPHVSQLGKVFNLSITFLSGVDIYLNRPGNMHSATQIHVAVKRVRN